MPQGFGLICCAGYDTAAVRGEYTTSRMIQRGELLSCRKATDGPHEATPGVGMDVPRVEHRGMQHDIYARSLMMLYV